MTIICSICMDTLISENYSCCSAYCGHVFHRECLLEWFQIKSMCPICNDFSSEFSFRPLFFSVIDDIQSELTAAVRNLMAKNDVLTNNVKSLEERLLASEEELKTEREKNVVSAEKLEQATKSVRYLKQLRKVAELDTGLSSPIGVAYLENISTLTHENLLTHCAGLTQRLRILGDEQASTLLRLGQEETRSRALLQKLRRLQEEQQANRNANQQGANTTAGKPKEVIVLDSDSEDDEEEKNNSQRNTREAEKRSDRYSPEYNKESRNQRASNPDSEARHHRSSESRYHRSSEHDSRRPSSSTEHNNRHRPYSSTEYNNRRPSSSSSGYNSRRPSSSSEYNRDGRNRRASPYSSEYNNRDGRHHRRAPRINDTSDEEPDSSSYSRKRKSSLRHSTDDEFHVEEHFSRDDSPRTRRRRL